MVLLSNASIPDFSLFPVGNGNAQEQPEGIVMGEPRVPERLALVAVKALLCAIVDEGDALHKQYVDEAIPADSKMPPMAMS